MRSISQRIIRLCWVGPPCRAWNLWSAICRRSTEKTPFCTPSLPRAVHRLLLGLSREYAGAPVNLFEPVCLSALGLTLCGRSPLALDLTPDEVEKLARGFENRTMIRPALENALNRLEEQLALPGRALRYAAQCLPKLEEAVRAALELGKPERAFLLPADENVPEPELFYGESMDSRDYERLLARLVRQIPRRSRRR